MKKNSFSLVELLLTIGVISLLAALALPVFQHVQAKSRQTFCSNNLRQIGLGLQMYAQEGSRFRLPTCAGALDRSAGPDSMTVLLPYLSQSKTVFRCPADNKYFAQDGSSYDWNVMVNGKELDEKELTMKDIKLIMPVMFDTDNFHGPAGKLSSKNYLYLPANVKTELIYSN